MDDIIEKLYAEFGAREQSSALQVFFPLVWLWVVGQTQEVVGGDIVVQAEQGQLFHGSALLAVFDLADLWDGNAQKLR